MTDPSGATPIPTVLCIDVEPDGNTARPGSRWLGFESMVGYLDELRDRLAAATGSPARFTWTLRLDPQIEDVFGSAAWIAERYARELDGLRAAGDVFGAHTHAWRRRGADSSAWVADWADPAWVDACVERTLASFAAAFGQPCTIHRFGDRFISSRVHSLLGARGVLVDLTVEPGARAVRALHDGWRGTAPTPDYAPAPRRPYRPSPDDPLRATDDPDADGPWYMPLTAVDASDALPLWRRIAREVRYPGRVRHRPVVLWAPGPAGALWAAVARELAASPAPYLAFALRSDVLLSPGSGLPLRDKVEALLASPLARRLSFTDPVSALGSVLATATPG